MKWRRRLSSSDLSMEDRRAHKHIKHCPRDQNGYRTSESNMVSRGSNHYDRSQKSSYLYDGDVESDADERHSRRKDKAVVYRQLKEIERVQRQVAPSGLSSEQEIHVHYVPIISNSPTNPFRFHGLSPSLANKHEIPHADKNTTQRSTMSHSSRGEQARSPTLDSSHKHSTTRSKHGHEKRGKHGKKADPYLEPLKQRWICYECGKIRSDKIRERHPLAVDQKMQPNWCGRCRITHECEGKPLAWYGQRHYCWGCGIVRSEKYHRENVLEPDQPSGPNYCRPCREASPGYEHNLREASEIGGETTGYDKAFMRQVHDASLSDIAEDKDNRSSAPKERAPGKENDARQGLLKSREATSSMLKNRSFKTKASSETSSDSSVAIEKLEGMHLEGGQKLKFGAKAGEGGARLSAVSSYKPPSVESASGCNPAVGGDVKACHISRSKAGHLAQAGGNGGCEVKGSDSDTADKACQARISSVFQVPPSGPETTASPLQAQQSDSDSRPTTCGTDDSVASRGFHSGTSRTSALSMRFRARRNPAETSTGSPPERECLAMHENIGDELRYKPLGSRAYARNPAQYGAQEVLPQGTSGGDAHFSGVTGVRDASGFPAPPTPPHESCWPHDQQPDLVPDRYMMNGFGWAAPTSPPTAPMIHGHSASLAQPDGHGAHYGAGYSGSSSGPEYSTKPGSFGNFHNGFNSAAHFSDAHCRRDFSGDSYYDSAAAQEYDYNKSSQPRSGFAQTQQSCQYVQQPEYDPTSQYRPQAQHVPQGQCGFHNEPGILPEHSVNGLSRQDSAFGGDSGESPQKDFDFSFIGQSRSGWAAGTYVPTNEEINAYMERNFADPRPETGTPCTEPQWEIYEDEGEGTALEQQASDARPGTYAWRDGKTSVHHVGSSTPGNTVTILSIREITSDEDLSAKPDDERGCDDDDRHSDAFSSLTAFQIG
ncbi:hypothetical protein KVR01_000770 [Diaporthe batatas]|uniref:uncharacterized protein n=1 Tax=Diaporthe batatas TaxID=748121 RepID=UPI001D05B396|nr:uncharacterized protein KVR01_000770 [Diaporthe batatas]KAG8170025.1 hypothetical protein KVR01_000770 [Diaporthe batatas]